jgi:1,4-dihydroxy-6-naphthoate synthase
MKIQIGFSPCPNDTFIFDALVHGKIDTEGLAFEPVLEDVETLNEWALQGKLAVTKLSFPAFFSALPHYKLLEAGSALGKGVGPLLVAKKNWHSQDEQLVHHTIALPGYNTTAHLLFSLAYPLAHQKKFQLFSTIEETVLNEQTHLGVLIHENRFTYEQKGLQKIKDLGAFWEESQQVPIPLGGIAVHQSLPLEHAKKIQALIRKSLSWAWSHYPALSSFVKEQAQAMEEKVMRQHIELYVNEYTHELQPEGKQAIRVLYKTFLQLQGNTTTNVETASLFI